MRIASAASLAAICLGLVAPRALDAQWDVLGKAALPAVPYWWTASRSKGIDLIPLLWTNDVDGGSAGCCVVGAAGRARLGRATLWFGLGFGTDPDGGTPAAIEAAAQVDWGSFAYRSLNGRTGLSLFFPVYIGGDKSPLTVERLSVGVTALSLEDDRYFDPVPLFSCPDSPVAPCSTVETPYPWSPDQDYALAVEGSWGSGEWRAPRVTGSVVLGLKVAGGDYSYLRGEVGARVDGAVERFDYLVRGAAGFTSVSAPLQRRFLLAGADPVTRWLDPYLDVRGALFQDVPYFVPGGPQLRAYQNIQPLTTGYLSLAGELSDSVTTPSGFWGGGGIFVETAWTPGIPDRLGRDQLNPDGSFLFDWRELPMGEDTEGGHFNTSTLEVARLWADAGVTLAGGFRNLAAAVSFPLWASNAAFADAPIGGGQKSAFALRWTLTIVFYPYGRPGVRPGG